MACVRKDLCNSLGSSSSNLHIGLAMRFIDRQERGRYMDSLEHRMKNQRQQIERTLDQTKGSGRLSTALQKLRSTLPSLPRRASMWNGGECESATESM